MSRVGVLGGRRRQARPRPAGLVIGAVDVTRRPRARPQDRRRPAGPQGWRWWLRPPSDGTDAAAATPGPVTRAASPPHGRSGAPSSRATGGASARPAGVTAGPSPGTIAGAADSALGGNGLPDQQRRPGQGDQVLGLVRADRLPADQVDDRGRDQAARRDRARPGESGRQLRADRADGERDRQRQVERAQFVRGVHACLTVVAEEQHRRGDRELRQRQRDQQAAPGQPPAAPGRGDGHGREHPGGEVVVEEGAAEPHPPGHRVRAALPVDAGGAACQVRLEHVSGQPRDLAVDLSRDGHADRVAIHALVVRERA